MISILVAEPCLSARNMIEQALGQNGFRVIPVGLVDLNREMRDRGARAAIIGPSHAESRVLRQVQEQLREVRIRIPLLLLVPESSEELAIAALRCGISEYLRFPCSPVELAEATRQSLQPKSRCELKGKPVSAAGAFASMIGESQPMRDVKAYLSRAASTDSNILITGETGTGKELAADYVHRHSARRDKPFVTVNCAAIPDTLLESELFGYERGAFTGAQASRDGKLKSANGGTVFLDEIGDMSPTAQAKILRVIDNKEIQRLGGPGVSVDVRIIAATNQELDTLIQAEKFRRDLYFRLHVARVHLPPLRERKEDILPIVSYYLRDFNHRLGRNVEGLTDAAWEYFLAYDWPGNVRELKNVVEALFIDSSSGEVSPGQLPRYLRDRCQGASEIPSGERERLLSALVSTNWNKSRAADKLRWSRMTLYRKMAKYQVADSVD